MIYGPVPLQWAYWKIHELRFPRRRFTNALASANAIIMLRFDFSSEGSGRSVHSHANANSYLARSPYSTYSGIAAQRQRAAGRNSAVHDDGFWCHMVRFGRDNQRNRFVHRAHDYAGLANRGD